MNRRQLLVSGGALALAGRARAASLLDLALPDPVVIEAIDVLRHPRGWLVRARDRDGGGGLALTNERIEYLYPILQKRVIPFFLGKDARDLEALVDGVHVWESNYKLAGLPFGCCVGWVEMALLDLLGRRASRPIGRLFAGQTRRTEVPMYLSSTSRDTTPEQELERFQRGIEATGARAVKFKVGGRMSRGADAAPGRSEKLVALLRKRLGDGITLYADANGSYDVAGGVRMGRLLEDHGVAIYEEPCPFDEYEQTRQVTAALRRVQVAGGEQDTSQVRFREMIRTRVVDVVQPDLNYNGGFVRATRVARMAAAARMHIAPHCPQLSGALYVLHFAAFTPNLGAFQEFHMNLVGKAQPFEPALQVKDGVLRIPAAPGLGVTVDPEVVKEAKPV